MSSTTNSSIESPLVGDVDRGTVFIVLVAIFGFVSIATTGMRLTWRTLNRQLGLDDFFIGLASALLVAQMVFNGLEYRSGFGRHIHYLSESQSLAALKWNYMSQFFLFVVVCMTKVSICLFVLRIKNSGWLKWCLYSLMAGLGVTTLLCEIILFAQCRPIHAFWNRKSGTCWNPAIYNDVIWIQVGRY